MDLTRGGDRLPPEPAEEGVDLIYLLKLEFEQHVIMQKFYRPIATFIAIDYDRAPCDVQCHLIQKMIELLRGIFTILTRYDQLPTLTPHELERLAVALLHQLPRTCAGYAGENGDIEVESFKASIHAEAQNTLLQQNEWRPLRDALAGR